MSLNLTKIKAAESAAAGASSGTQMADAFNQMVDAVEDLDQRIESLDTPGSGYAPPPTGIPKTDLASDVQTLLDKAGTALQEFTETDPEYAADKSFLALKTEVASGDATTLADAKTYTDNKVAGVSTVARGSVFTTTGTSSAFSVDLGNAVSAIEVDDVIAVKFHLQPDANASLALTNPTNAAGNIFVDNGDSITNVAVDELNVLSIYYLQKVSGGAWLVLNRQRLSGSVDSGGATGSGGAFTSGAHISQTVAPVMLAATNGTPCLTGDAPVLTRVGNMVTMVYNGANKSSNTASTISLCYIPEGFRPSGNVAQAIVVPAVTVNIQKYTSGTNVFPEEPGVNDTSGDQWTVRASAQLSSNADVSINMSWMTADAMPAPDGVVYITKSMYFKSKAKAMAYSDLHPDVECNYPVEPVFDVTFEVVDESNQPVEGATVIFDGETLPGYTAKDVDPGTYPYTVELEGYENASGNVVVDDDDVVVGVELVEELEEELEDFESIKLVIDSSDGEFVVPTRGYGASAQNATYNWIIEGSLDGKDYNQIQTASGTSSSTGGIDLTIPSGLQSQNMYLRIRDYTKGDNYAWARAFACGIDTTLAGASTNLAKIKTADLSNAQNGFRLDGTSALGYGFLYAVFRGCSSLTSVTFPNASNWYIESIGNNCLSHAFNGCSSLVSVQLSDTSGWNIYFVGNGFFQATYQNCGSLVSAELPDSSGWNEPTIGSGFLLNSFNSGSFISSGGILTIKDNVSNPIYTGQKVQLGSNSAGIANSRISTIYVPTALVSAFQSSDDWSNITDSKFIGNNGIGF